MSENNQDDLDIPFEPNEWIERGRSYDTAPLYVLLAREERERVPALFQKLYPSSSLSFDSFIHFPLPKCSYSLSSYSPGKWFSKEPPVPRSEGELWKLLYARPLPTSRELETLHSAFGQQWLDGAQSICDPRINSGKDRYPLWFLTVWLDMLSFTEIQTSLKKAHAAAQELVAHHPVADEFPTVESVFRHLKWNETFLHGGVAIMAHEFAPLLRKVMLSSIVTQGMISYLQDRLCQDTENAQKHYICGTGFAAFIAVAAKRNKLDSRCLQDIEHAVKRYKSLQVWVPVLREQHEVVIKIDFGAKTIGYGDTLPNFSPPKVIERHSWNTGGCYFMYSIAHGIWGDELWSDEKKMLDRIRWFVKLTENSNTEPPSSIDDMATTSIARTRPDLNNLLLPQSNVEHLTRADLLDVTFMVPDATASSNPEGESEIQNIEQDVSSVSKPPECKGLNAAWGMFMKKTAEATTKRNRSPSPAPNPPRKKAKDTDSSESSSGPTGLSKAAIAEKRYAQALDEGKFDEKKMRAFREECLRIDERAEFSAVRLRAVRCSNCGRETTCQAKQGAPNSRRFLKHYRNCTQGRIRIPKASIPASKTSTLTSGIFKGFKKLSAKISHVLGVSSTSHLSQSPKSLATSPPSPALKQFPCPGITAEYQSKVNPYLHRSSALGGGSRSITKIAADLFKSPFRTLDEKQKDQVIDQQDSEHTCRNNHRRMNVRSVACLQVTVDTVCSSKAFNNALNHKIPPSDHHKFTNERFQNRLLAHQWASAKGLQELIQSAEEGSIYAHFAQGAISGKFDDEGVFLGLVHAMVQKQDRRERGVGMQNFAYAPEWDQFMHIASIHSPRTYEFIRSKFPGRTKRSFQMQESKAPMLSMVIEEATYTSVANHLAARGYSGPINVACDDSKLLSSFRLHYDSKQRKHFLVGGINGPIFVPNPEALADIMNDSTVKRGTKVRLWTGTIPLPDIPPFVIAAIPILDSMSVPDLLELHKKIIFGLLKHRVKVISYACDGTENERGVQQAFLSIADSVIEHTIPDPHPGQPPLVIRIPVFGKQPIVMIQDSKHALKTFRNNLFSGARLLVLGNYLAMYRDIHALAFEDGSPLYHRDVEKVDKQDDNAAARLGAAQTLRFLTDKHPEMLGLIIYLFVFMEIPDAYQNRHIAHDERINMLLRARYFVNMWVTHLDHCPGYTLNGLISLVIVHRDFYPKIPLIPHLHSTEPCEHNDTQARGSNSRDVSLEILW
ncbi:hypothetical protein F5880DRAFT_1618539 [Lentinula raphanica]|nr:hypothetical protein F5880DRAFT_1618539 [Lentinula raphanica]